MKSGSSDSCPVQNIFDLQSLTKTPNCLSKYPVYEWTLSVAPNSEIIATFRGADLFPISKGELLRAATTIYVLPHLLHEAGNRFRFGIFIVAPCIMDSLNLLHTNECTVIL